MSDFTPEMAFRECREYCDILVRIIDKLALEDGMLKEGWEAEIKRLKELVMPSVLIGIFGPTGAGKSSLLNAILDRNILGISGVNACTAAVTEISWHSDTNMRATITFLSESEWREELHILLGYFQDIDEHGFTNKADTKIALAKLLAVYPTITERDLARMSMDQIIAYDNKITSLLNSKPVVIIEQEPILFGRKIQQYTEALKKNHHKDTKGANTAVYWPLVKKASIQCNAEILSTGAILVDLPGVADANAARNQIARDYQKRCEIVWIAAPVARAADDKVSQDFCDSALENQLKMDLQFDGKSLAFIATKCDDVQAAELIRELQLEEDEGVVVNLERISKCETMITDNKTLIKNLLAEKTELRRQRDLLYKLVDTSENLDISNTDTGSKRRINDTDLEAEQSSKRPKTTLSNGIEYSRNELPSLQTLTMKVDAVHDQIEEIRSHIVSLEQNKKIAELALNAFCSSRRSQVFRERKKREFRHARKGSDDRINKQLSTVESGRTTNSYREVTDVPVFTVSSRDYIKVSHPEPGDGGPACFPRVEDSEIPALRQWCHAQTLPFRKATAIAFLNDIQTLAACIATYLNDANQAALEDKQALQRRWQSTAFYNRRGNRATRKGGVVGHLDKKFLDLVKKTVLQLQGRFRDGLEEDCVIGAKFAAKNALGTLQKMISAEETRMHWQTLRATLHRDGSWKENINFELANPLTITILDSWCAIFEADMFADFREAAVDIISQLLKEVEGSVSAGAVDHVRSQTEVCLKEAKVALEATLTVVRKTMTLEQKSASRCYEPYIQEQLRDVGYRPALQEKGKGSVDRQRKIIEDAVENSKDTLFIGAADVLLHTLEGAANRIGDDLETKMHQIGKKVENTLSIIWSRPPISDEQKKALKSIQIILKIIELSRTAIARW